jgi:outer membrane protein assembly factor BamB
MNREIIMLRRFLPVFAVLLVAVVALPAPVPKQKLTSWAMLGGTPGRNMANPDAGTLPDDFHPEDDKQILWKAELGSLSYTQPVVAGGRVFVGTDNKHPRNERDTKIVDGKTVPNDRGVLMCFNAKDGKFLWQAVHDTMSDKFPCGEWLRNRIAITPVVDGDRVYYLTSRNEVVCADVAGFADGNQGDQTEKYTDATDADILWSLDLGQKFGVECHGMPVSSPLVVGDTLFAGTGNGVGENHLDVPAPNAPSLVALDKQTGKLLWSDNSPGKNILHGQWSSPAYTDKPVPQVIYGGGDGWLRAFEPNTGKLLWKFDCNPKSSKYKISGDGDRNNFLATPVISGERLYIGTGEDPEHFTGPANLWCLDLRKAIELGKTNSDRDVSPVEDCFDPTDKRNAKSALAWHFGGKNERKFALREFRFGRTLSTCCVADGVLYAAELRGMLHCLDATTGKRYWMIDLKSAIWGSPFYADGKVFVPTHGDLFVIQHRAKPFTLDADDERAKAKDGADANKRYRDAIRDVEKTVVIRKVEFDSPIPGTPSAVNGVLYVATDKTLYAIRKE